MILKPILLLLCLAVSSFFGWQVYEGDIPRLLAFFLWAVTFFMGFIVAMKIEREVDRKYGSVKAAPLLIKAVGGLALGYDVGSNTTLGTTMFFVVDLLDFVFKRRWAGGSWNFGFHRNAFSTLTKRLAWYRTAENKDWPSNAMTWRYHVAVYICGQLNRHDAGHC